MNKVVDGKCKVFSYSNVGNNASTFYFVHRENEKFATELGISNYVSFKSYFSSFFKHFLCVVCSYYFFVFYCF